MTRSQPDTDELLTRAGGGDRDARAALLQRFRQRLRRMVAVRMDPRLAARIDPSDVVQEALVEADRRLDGFLSQRPVSFYPWLRRLAWERLVEQHRRHVRAARRSVTREEAEPPALPEGSALRLADRLLASGSCPSEAARRSEVRRQVRDALARLSERDREVLVLRHLEELTAREVGEVLGIGEAAAKVRALRALRRLRALMNGGSEGGR